MPPAVNTQRPQLIETAWLEAAETRAVFAALQAGGHEGRAVGGAVRDALLGLPVKDIDIATPAVPQEVIRLASAAGLETVATGLKHGTVTVISDGVPFEVTTLRKDVETFGRHATVAYTDDWKADAERRDFTINAFYCSADGTVHDPLGGYADLEARRVRFIGDANERIREDYLRTLRFFRFTAEYGDGRPDPEGLGAAVRERAGLKLLSGERIHRELVRLLIAPHAAAAVEAMYEHGLITQIIGFAPRPGLFRRLLEIEGAQVLAPHPMLRLAVLVVEITEDAERLSARLKLSNAERDRLMRAADRHGPAAPADQAQAKALIYRQGAEAYRDAVLVAWARSPDAQPTDLDWAAKLKLANSWRAPKFTLTGDDVLKLGVEPGPRVGELLRRVEDWWIAAGFPDDRALIKSKLEAAVLGS